ncbi:MAG: flagellar biosynthesis repressor protein FlbT [Aliidongia sp.]|jgi:flagellar protein FlbT|nr:flagellar biosynthesis repressor protein FlbT [Aliidongia sp.]
MPLSIPLPAGAKIIINGAVVQNTGGAYITLTIHNKANILRDKDVLTPAEANTPAKEVYYAVQNAYLFESNRAEWEKIAHEFLDRHEATVPEAAEIISHVRSLMQEDKLYNAMRASRRLIALEAGEPIEPFVHGADSNPEQRPSGVGYRPMEIDRLKSKLAEMQRRLEALDPNG